MLSPQSGGLPPRAAPMARPPGKEWKLYEEGIPRAVRRKTAVVVSFPSFSFSGLIHDPYVLSVWHREVLKNYRMGRWKECLVQCHSRTLNDG